MKLTKRGSTLLTSALFASALALGLVGCGTTSQVDDEAKCYGQAYDTAIEALDSGVPTDAVPAVCSKLPTTVLDDVKVRLDAQLHPLLVDPLTGHPTPAYQRLLTAKRTVSV